MANRKKSEDSKLTRDDLEAQMKLFLQQGGKVNRIPKGKSGVIPSKGSIYAPSKTKK